MTVGVRDTLENELEYVTRTSNQDSHLFGCLLRDVELPELLQEHRVDVLGA